MKKLILVVLGLSAMVAGSFSLLVQKNVENETNATIATEIPPENAPLFYDGKGFFTYRQPLDGDKLANGKLKVVYFFDYDCAACITADDYLKQYAKYNPEKIELVRYPYFKEGRVFVAKMHAALEMLGKPELSALYMFDSAGKKGDDSLIDSNLAVTKWFEKYNLDVTELNRIWQSDELKKRVDEYADIYRKYRPIAAPFVSINGKYLLVQNTLYNDDYTYAVLDHIYENRNNLAVLDYKAPKLEEPKKETK